MAKAKFPGKPPKTSQITRLRVSSHCVPSCNDPSRSAAQQAIVGLRLFNQHFSPDDENDDDFVGFEKIDKEFHPRFQPKTSQLPDVSVSKDCCVPSPERDKQKAVDSGGGVKWPHSFPGVNNTVDKSSLMWTNHQHTFVKDSVPESFGSQVAKPSWNSVQPSYVSLQNGNESKKESKKKLPAVASQPVKSVFTLKPAVPTKRFLDKKNSSFGKKPSDERDGLCHKSRSDLPKRPPPPPVVEEHFDQDKMRMKKEIERYTSIMTTEDQRQASEERKKHKKSRSPSSGTDKEGKLREKIQQLLRSQWESRLQLVDAPPAPPPVPLVSFERNESRVSSSMSASTTSSSASSEDDVLFYKRRRMNSHSSTSSSARKSKSILRKARLQLNHKLLKQLRQPSRLQQLVEPKPISPDPPRTGPSTSSSSSILRPAQLVLQATPTPSPFHRLQSPSRSSTQKEPAKVVKPPKPPKPAKLVSPPPPQPRLKKSEDTEDITVTNPLGCAFVLLSESNDSKGIPGTVVCGVCGAVRRYSFILQARKFGTFSCEPCRKFISRVLRARVAVKCSTGSYSCIQPPAYDPWNSTFPPEDRSAGSGEVMTARCKACWLKLALTGFQMRDSDHDELRSLLPTTMQGTVPLAANRPANLPWAPNRGQMIRLKGNTSSTSTAAKAGGSVNTVTVVSKVKIKTKRRDPSRKGSKTKTRINDSLLETPVHTSGPRVKHVCRTALPNRPTDRATFQSDETTERSTDKKADVCDCCSTLQDSKASHVHSETTTSRTVSTVSNKHPRTTDRKNSLCSPAMPLTITLGERSRVTCRDKDALSSNQRVGLMTPAARAWQQQDTSRNTNSQSRLVPFSSAGRRPAKPLQKGMLLPDLWERYDADRVWDQGFAICGSQQLADSPPLCYLCGSAGRNELVCCASCCEPFHPFCVADSAPLPGSDRSECHHWDRKASASRLQLTDSHGSVLEEKDDDDDSDDEPPLVKTKPWICLNCVTCRICQSSSGERMICSTCSSAYHWSCIGPAHPNSQRKSRSKWNCFSCTPVQDKVCPLCFKCHTRREMKLECNCCGVWVHAGCEQLPEEDFRLLSASPKIEYICRLCGPEKIWLGALRHHLNSLYARVLADFADQQAVSCPISSSQLDIISDKVARDEYKSCAEFSSDVRLLANQNSDLVESLLLAVMPWIQAEEKPRAPRQKITMAVKIEYDEKLDSRLCALCHGRGEGAAVAEGRLVYCGNDAWVHVNCALWSNEVFEEVDGALQNVYEAMARAGSSRCNLCDAKGATVSCCTRGCTIAFHFPCALQQEAKASLLDSKRLICHQHAKSETGKCLTLHSSNFEVARCVYVDLGAERKRIKAQAYRDLRVVIGSLNIAAIGHLRSDVSGDQSILKPIGYQSHRKFWSTKDPSKLVSYTLRTIYVPGTCEGKETETNVTVSHEEDDVIMAESGLNLAELDTQDDRELIHMVLEDANFEQELEGGPNAAVATSSPTNHILRDSGFCSDGRSVDETSPSPAEEHALEAWLADPEHAVIFLDSALLASLDIDSVETSPSSANTSTDDIQMPANGSPGEKKNIGSYPRLPESGTPPKRSLRKRRLNYSQWKKMRLQSRKVKSATSILNSDGSVSHQRPSALDWNGNEAEWNSASSSSNSNSLLASIKVSPLSSAASLKSVDADVHWRKGKNKPKNILQLDGAADSSETESDSNRTVSSPFKVETDVDETPVKCRRCRRSYRTWQSFNKHTAICVEMLSSSSSGGVSEEESAEENPICLLQPKTEPIDESESTPESNPTSIDMPSTIQPKQELGIEPIQVPIVNSSSMLLMATCSNTQQQAKVVEQKTIPKTVATTTPKPRHRRPPARPNLNVTPSRTLAVRQQPGEIRFAVHNPPPTTYQVTLQSPPPPPILYVNSSGYLTQAAVAPVTQQQQHFIIMPSPPIEQSFTQTTLSVAAQPTVTNNNPMVQYLGSIPANLLSALGIVNFTTVPTLQLHSQPLQITPWGENQIVVLPQPQQHIVSFHSPLASQQTFISPIPPPQTTVVTTAAAAPPPPVSVDTPKADDSTATKACVNSTENPEKESASVSPVQTVQRIAPKPLEPSNELILETFLPLESSSPSPTLLELDITPPKPSYSYRSSMSSGEKKKSAKILPIFPSVLGTKTNSPNAVKLQETAAQQTSPAKEHKEVVPSPIADTVKEPEPICIDVEPLPDDLMITEMAEVPTISISEDCTGQITILNQATSEVCDVFATPPASSEPPILPSDLDVDNNHNKSTATTPWTAINANPGPNPLTTINNNTIPQKKGAHIMYELVSNEGFYAQSDSMSAVWKKLLDSVQEARLRSKLEPLHNGCLKSINERNLNLTGLHHNAIINLLEQLPNADLCTDYKFKYRTHHRDRESADLVQSTGHKYGSIRAAPYSGRSAYDMFGWLASQYRVRPQPVRVSSFTSAKAVTTVIASSDQEASQQPSAAAVAARRVTNFELLPMTVRFKHLRQVARHSVGVYRSRIHGRGLFCKRDIECGEMVVEYAGQVIRSVLCDKREKKYEAKGMGCYMFRIDDQTVVDATVHGNAARFINHSCEPNCYSRIVDIFGKKHIIIFALRRIQRGEELTYDYKFPLEDVKIPCTCGSRRCRKYLN